MAYMDMARGSPYVVPSCEKRVVPSMKKLVGFRYVLMRIVARGGQKCLMFSRAALRLRQLNALLASTKRTACVYSSFYA